MRWPRACWRCRQGRAGTRCFPCGEHADQRRRLRDHLFELRKKGFNRLFQDGRLFEFSTPESLLDIDFSKPVFVLVDRIAIRPDLHQRLVDTIEICYREAGEVDFRERRGGGERLRFNEKFQCKTCGLEFAEPEPILFSFNSPAGACPRCQGFGNTIDFDMDRVIPDKTLSLDEGAVEPWTKPQIPLLAGRISRSTPRALRFGRAAFCDLTPGGARQARRFHPPLLRLPGNQEVQAARARVSEPLPRLRAVPGMPGRAAAQGSAVRARGREEPGRSGAHEHRRGARVLRRAGAGAGRERHRRQDSGRDPAAAEVPERRGAGIPHAGPAVVHAFRRRGAAHPTGHLPGLAAGGRVLRAGRAFHRAAQPRHRAADPHPGGTARTGQHHRGGGARSRRDAGGGPHRGSGPGRRRARRARSSSKGRWRSCWRMAQAR